MDFLIIARPSGFLGAVPHNVEVKFNVPYDVTWGRARQANAILVPLLSENTCCGQITIVSAQQLGIPIITTQSHGTREYTDAWESTCVVQPGDVNEMVWEIEKVVDQQEKFTVAATRESTRAIRKYDRSLWREYVGDFIRLHCRDKLSLKFKSRAPSRRATAEPGHAVAAKV